MKDDTVNANTFVDLEKSGIPSGISVSAIWTCEFVYLFIGLGPDSCGFLHVLQIGLHLNIPIGF